MDNENYKIDMNYVMMYRCMKYSMFVIFTYLIVYFSIKSNSSNSSNNLNNNDENKTTQYDVILLITVLNTILFYILDVNYPIANY